MSTQVNFGPTIKGKQKRGPATKKKRYQTRRKNEEQRRAILTAKRVASKAASKRGQGAPKKKP